MKKKAKNLVPVNKVGNGERVRLEGVVQQQADELKIKNGLLKNGAAKQVKSEEQINILKKAMEATVDGIFIVDAQKPDLPITYANQSFQKMTGYAKTEILGHSYFLFYGAEADPRLINEIKRTIRKGKTFHGELLNFKKSGKKYWNSLRIAPVYDSGGTITHYVGVQTDVTLIREKELEIDEQREELLHVTRVGKLAEFVSSLAHEISQPLTAILSYAQAAQRQLGDREPETQKILSYIINDDQRVAQIIKRLRLLLMKSVPEMRPLDINALISETVVLLATDATVRRSVIKTELDNSLSFVRGDRVQLQQVILNLISNSFDALESNKGSREIWIHTARKDNDTIIVEVKDNGCGIPEQNLPRLFTHFFTSKPDGLGMGLSISRSIIEAHGGRLDVQDNSERGVNFCFTLPIDKKDA
jgi:PAS domain S-box-containing protein